MFFTLDGLTLSHLPGPRDLLKLEFEPETFLKSTLIHPASFLRVVSWPVEGEVQWPLEGVRILDDTPGPGSSKGIFLLG